MPVEEQIKKFLEEFSLVTGVRNVALVSNDGLIISSLLRGIDPMLIGAMAASLLGASTKVSNELLNTNPEQIIIETRVGRIIVCPVSNIGGIVVIADPEANLGLILLEIGKYTEKISKLFA